MKSRNAPLEVALACHAKALATAGLALGIAAFAADAPAAKVKIDSEPLGTVKILSGPLMWVGGAPQIAFEFEADIASPWGAVNEKTVSMFYSNDAGELKNFVGTER